MIYGYCRVSTGQQDIENQRFEILKFCNEKKWQINEWVLETISGAKSFKERKLGQLLSQCKKGDTLVLTEMSRLGRSLLDVMGALHICMQNGIAVYTTKEKYELNNSINSSIYAFAFSLSSEIERQMISQRTKEALHRKKSEGIVLGRRKGSIGKSKLDGKEEVIKELLAKKVSKSSIAKIVGPVHPGTLESFIVTRRLVPPPKTSNVKGV